MTDKIVEYTEEDFLRDMNTPIEGAALSPRALLKTLRLKLTAREIADLQLYLSDEFGHLYDLISATAQRVMPELFVGVYLKSSDPDNSICCNCGADVIYHVELVSPLGTPYLRCPSLDLTDEAQVEEYTTFSMREYAPDLDGTCVICDCNRKAHTGTYFNCPPLPPSSVMA